MERREFLKKAILATAATAVAVAMLSQVQAMIDDNIDTPQKNTQMKKIVILNGSPRRNGYTAAALIQAFAEGAQGAGHEVREHYIHGMGVNACIGCDSSRLSLTVCSLGSTLTRCQTKKRDCVLLMTARGNDYTMALDQYGIFTKYLGWNSLGTVLGRGLTDEARTLGASIK